MTEAAQRSPRLSENLAERPSPSPFPEIYR
jgi:hypothetical protein